MRTTLTEHTRESKEKPWCKTRWCLDHIDRPRNEGAVTRLEILAAVQRCGCRADEVGRAGESIALEGLNDDSEEGRVAIPI